MAITPSIPASQLVAVNPSVLSAGGNAVTLNGLMLTKNPFVPIGSIQQFPNALAVGSYFGLSSIEFALATTYFNGYEGATVLPGNLLFAQYPTAPVSAYLRGGSVSAMTLTQLQALSGSLSVTINGTVETASSISLSAATSFSNAAEIIGQALGIEGVTQGTVTASIGGTFTATATTAKVLTVSAVLTGSLQVGDVVSGTDGANSLPAATTIVAQLTGTPGGIGTYTISAATTPSNMTSTTVTSLSKTLNVTVDSAAVISSGDILSGSGITTGTFVVSQISGTTGGVGLYNISTAQTVASETVTVFSPAVIYNSTMGAFVIFSSTIGVASTIGFASGTLANSLNLTSILGAVTSQGAIEETPSVFMNTLIGVTQNWAGFMTIFDPDSGSGNANKLLFSQWTNSTNDRYFYAAWDTDITPTESVPATSSLGFLLSESSLSGTILINEPVGTTVDLGMAAATLSWAACVNFNATNGRTTLAFRTFSGLTPTVTNGTVSANLLANGYSFYGQYSLNNNQFEEFQNGQISGQFAWSDSYINQIWMNANFQLTLMTFLKSVNSVPYNAAGNTMIATALSTPINAAGNAGVFQSGVTLAGSQIVAVNTAAGFNISNTLQTRGWYLLIQPSSPTTRAARSSPPITFFYVDGGSVQQITMGSVEIQ